MRSVCIIGILFFFSMIFVPAGLSQSRTLKPLKPGNKIVVRESGRSATYYSVSKENPSYLLVKGPGKLKAITRIILKSGDTAGDYSVVYQIDGGDPFRQEYYSVAASGKASIGKGISGKPGGMKVLEIELGPGEHSLEFNSASTNNAFLIKYLFKKSKAQKTRWVMISPSQPNEPVDLTTNENIVHYYRFSQKKPLNIGINGPTTLRILTRFENHYTMKGRIDYRVQVKEDQSLIHTYLLSSIYSEVTTYRKNNKLVPGKACEFYIDVPSGRHNYTIVPLDKDKSTILGRVLFPKKDVKLEE